MPHVQLPMLEADYWIRRIPEPDREVCSPEEKRKLEARWQEQGLLQDLYRLPETVSGRTLRSWLTEDFRYLERVARYDERGERLKRSDVRGLERNVNRQAVRERALVTWGMTVRPTPMKLLPTHRNATVLPLDLEFNVFSHSAIRLAEPLAIFHESRDREWLFVATEIGRGWVPARDIARADRSAVLEYRSRPFRIAVAAAVQLRQDDGTVLCDAAQMGTRLAVDDRTGKLDFPRKNPTGRLDFVAAHAEPAEGLADQPRAFTPGSFIEQAFRLLDVPYGWGGANGYGDCSEFIHAVGLTCGLTLPRSTAYLQKALPSQDLKAPECNKAEVLSALPGGVCLL